MEGQTMFLFKKLRQLRLARAEYRLAASQMKLLPSRQFPIDVFREDNKWVCMFMCDAEEPLNNVIAYGESPAQAVNNFDMLWTGAPEFLIDQEEEEEQF
jgi:hypothetical protein